ncbi:MAG: DUF1501 domain-containing protein [Acidimicrobiia bacterium]|nr:DUF1501 domain-containing protein [Acidimicrobiia bacterium]
MISRRRFITGLGAGVTVGLTGGYALTIWQRDPGSSSAKAASRLESTPSPGAFGQPGNDRTLVVVEMAGGNDGLNTVVPHATAAYYDLRPTIRIEDPLDLDGEIGLHPSLTFLADEFRAGRLAVVEGVGYPEPNLSHFESMATWWTADAGYTSDAGWLGRMLDGTVGFEHPLAGISIGPGPTQALLGDASFVVSIQDDRGLQPDVPPWIDNVDDLLGVWDGVAPAEPLAGSDALAAVGRATAATAAARDDLAAAMSRSGVDGGGRGRRGRTILSDQLAVAADLIASGLAPTVIYVHGFGDYDTHGNQLGRHEVELRELDEGIQTFFSALDRAGVGERAIVVTTSEFGRRAADNGSGTDHGTASSLFVMGSPVTGGRYGETPSLTSLDASGNMIHSVDFRSVYATVLESWLEVDSVAILNADYETLGFV